LELKGFPFRLPSSWHRGLRAAPAWLAPEQLVGLVVPLKSMLYRLGLPAPVSPVPNHIMVSPLFT
jgi:hypothetical protein